MGDSFLAIRIALAQAIYLRLLLQHMDVQIFMQLPGVLRSRQDLAGNSKILGAGEKFLTPYAWKFFNFR
jgi:hypothetical protein